jgi:hypothetical protein
MDSFPTASSREAINAVAIQTGDKDAEIRTSIIKYGFFMDVYAALKSVKIVVDIENVSYLPMVDRFMNYILKSGPYKIETNFNDKKLKYSALSGKEGVYAQILVAIGKAFLLAPASVVSTDIKNDEDRRKIIEENIKIPGLESLIGQYRVSQTATTIASTTLNQSTTSQNGFAQPTTSQSTSQATPIVVNNTAIFSPQSTYTPPAQQNQKLGFTQQEYSVFNLTGNTDGEKKIKQIIYELSLLNIDKYPFACATLYRTLIEAVANLKIERSATLQITATDLNGKLSSLNNKLHIANVNLKATIATCLSGQTFTKMLNHYIHDLAVVDVGTILQTWVTMKEMIKSCLA